MLRFLKKLLFIVAATFMCLDNVRAQHNTADEDILYLHTDRNYYLVGELLWFKLYNLGTTRSEVALVDLVDAKGTVILDAVHISLEPTKNNASMLLPLSLSSGYYRLRAYTYNSFIKPELLPHETLITIINPFKNLDTNSLQPAAASAIFRPEGGNLAMDIASKVAFMIEDKAGKQADYSGYILNSKKEKVASFQTSANGIGSFIFTPRDIIHKAVIKLNTGDSIIAALPMTLRQGWVMTTEESDDSLQVHLSNNFSSPAKASLQAYNKGVMQAQQTFIVSGNATRALSKLHLGTGVIKLVLKDEANKIIAERKKIISPKVKSSISVSLTRTEFDTRQPVEVAIETFDQEGKPISAELSVSVYPLDTFSTYENISLYEYSQGYSAISNYISSHRNVSSTDIDNLLVLQETISSPKQMLFNGLKDSSFLNTLPIAVKVTSTNTGLPAKAVEVKFAVIGQPSKFRTTITNHEGFAFFHTKELHGQQQLVFQVDPIGTETFSVEMIKPVLSAKPISPPVFFLPGASLIEKYSINMQVQNIYHADDMRTFYAAEIKDSTPFYGKPDYTYHLDNYTRFTTMEEVLREYIREISVGIKKGQRVPRILDEPRATFNEDNILLLWDGVPLPDPGKIFGLDPLKVKTIEIVARKFAAGATVFNGIANFLTYSRDLSGYQVPSSATMHLFHGMQLQREFHSPFYNTVLQQQSSIPDFRNTLFWNPNVLTTPKGSAKLNFFTSDRKGKYQIVIQGVTLNGEAVTTTTTFEVK